MENKVTNSLAKHTKAQLIDIIFRKDEVEKTLRTQIKAIQDKYDEVEYSLNNYVDSYEKLHNDFENACDEIATIRVEKSELKTKYKGLSKVLLLVTIVLLIVIVTLLIL